MLIKKSKPLESPRIQITMTDTLQKILGFDGQGLFNRIEPLKCCSTRKCDSALLGAMMTKVSKKPINTRVRNQNIFVYCVVADLSLDGDSAAQILRAIPIQVSVKSVVQHRFHIPHYVLVLTDLLETIQFTLANDLVDVLRFEIGKSMIELHFRPFRPY